MSIEDTKYFLTDDYCKVTTTDDDGNLKDIWLRRIARKPIFLIEACDEAEENLRLAEEEYSNVDMNYDYAVIDVELAESKYLTAESNLKRAEDSYNSIPPQYKSTSAGQQALDNITRLNEILGEAEENLAALRITLKWRERDCTNAETKLETAQNEFNRLQNEFTNSEEKGGFIEREDEFDDEGNLLIEGNLSQEGDCWIADNAKVYGNARISGDAIISDNAKIYGNARISDNSKVFDSAKIYGNAQVYGASREFKCPECGAFVEFEGEALGRQLRRSEDAKNILNKAKDKNIKKINQLIKYLDAIKNIKDEYYKQVLSYKNIELEDIINERDANIEILEYEEDYEVKTHIELEIIKCNAIIDALMTEITSLNARPNGNIDELEYQKTEYENIKNTLESKSEQDKTDEDRNNINRYEIEIKKIEYEIRVRTAEDNLNNAKTENDAEEARLEQNILDIERVLFDFASNIKCYKCKIKWSILDKKFCSECFEEKISDEKFFEFECCDRTQIIRSLDESNYIGSSKDDNVLIFGNAEVYGNAKVFNNAQINGVSKVFGEIRIFENAKVQGGAVCGLAQIYGDAIVARKVSNVEQISK